MLTRVVPNNMADEEAHLSAFLPNEARFADGEPDAEGESSRRLLRFVGLAMSAGAGEASKYAPKPGELSSDAEPENEGEAAMVGLRVVGAGESTSMLEDDAKDAFFGDKEALACGGQLMASTATRDTKLTPKPPKRLDPEPEAFSFPSPDDAQVVGMGALTLSILRSGIAGGGMTALSSRPKELVGLRGWKPNGWMSAVMARLGRAKEGREACV